jgi:DNA repair exonuclease SbcCD ATPase subunit
MFFGGKGRAESVKPDELYPLLNSLFDKKLGPFKTRTASILNELQEAKTQFSSACKEFEGLDEEPYTEDLYAFNVNFIKGQKNLYARAQKRLIDDLELESESAQNAYDGCASIVSNVESVTKEMLKTNANFRQVVQCYPNRLREFKKSFSAIERLTKSLRGELDKSEGEFSDYKAVRERISELNLKREELEMIGKRIETMKKDSKPDGEGDSSKNELDASERLSNKKAELAKVSDEGSRLYNKINLMTAPLERVAKKLDHLSAGKKQLHAFIEDPISSISNEAEYSEFRALVQKLNKAVETEEVSVKNRAEVSRGASELLNIDIYSMINSYRSIQQRTSELSNEIRSLETALGSVREERATYERRVKDIEALERRADEIRKAVEASKSAVERLFSDCYLKPILIDL